MFLAQFARRISRKLWTDFDEILYMYGFLESRIEYILAYSKPLCI